MAYDNLTIKGQVSLVPYIQAIKQDEIFSVLAPYLKFCKSKVRWINIPNSKKIYTKILNFRFSPKSWEINTKNFKSLKIAILKNHLLVKNSLAQAKSNAMVIWVVHYIVSRIPNIKFRNFANTFTNRCPFLHRDNLELKSTRILRINLNRDFVKMWWQQIYSKIIDL